MAAEPILDVPRVVAGFGERKPAAMTQHVGVDGPQSRLRSDALDVAVDGARCERAAALGHKNERRAGGAAVHPERPRRAAGLTVARGQPTLCCDPPESFVIMIVVKNSHIQMQKNFYCTGQPPLPFVTDNDCDAFDLLVVGLDE